MQDFAFLSQVGEGTSGKVYLAKKHSESHMVAVKVMSVENLWMQQNKLEDLDNEIRVHWALNECEGALQLREIYEQDNNVCLVLEYQPEGSLYNHFDVSAKFSENQVKIIMEQLLLTIDFLHKKNLVHRDIKLDNILISKIEDEDKFNVKLGDFGLTAFLKEGQNLDQICGSPSYIAPEVLKGLPYDYKCDIFSAGAVFYNLLTGRYLFDGDSIDQILLANRDCDLTGIFPIVHNLSP